MKAVNLNKNSWHYYIAQKLGSYRPQEYVNDTRNHKTDICTYTSFVLKGFFLLFVMGIAIAFVGFLFWNVLFGIIFSIIYGTIIFTDIAIAIFMFLLAVIISATLFVGITMIKSKLENTESDGFIKTAYKSWKEKFCVKINFTNSNSPVNQNKE